MEIPNELPEIDLSPPKEEPKEPFCFSYIVPSLDWFDTKTVTIGPQDYYYFRLERRFGPSWWLIGSNPTDDDSGHYWTDTQLGELRDCDLYRFIEWAKSPWGSKIVEVKALSGEFNIIDDIADIARRMANG